MKELGLRVEKYLKKAKPLFKDLKKTEVDGVDKKTTQHFYDMATAYYNDALHFYEAGNYINALAALEYAEGWLDAGAALGIFDVKRPI